MESSKLIATYKNLGKEDLKALGDFVCSPFFNKHLKVRQLHELIALHLHTNQLHLLSKEVAHKNIFPNQDFDAQKVSDLMTYLYRLTEQFVAVKSFMQAGGDKQLHRLSSLRQKGLTQKVETTIRKLTNDNELSDYEKYRVFSEADLNFVAKGVRQADENLQKKADYLDRFYIAEKLRTACEMLNRNRIVNAGYNAHFINEVVAIVNNNESLFEGNNSTLIYRDIFLMLTQPADETHFTSLKNRLEHEQISVNEAEAYNIFSYAQNYCIRKINEGAGNYLQEIFKLYQLQVKQNRICLNGELSEWDYKNIVTVGCRLKEFVYTAQFIEAWQPMLNTTIRVNAYNYNLANLLYEKGDITAALRLLQAVKFTDVYYNLSARSILMKAAYEEGDFDLLAYTLESFNAFVVRHQQIPANQKRAHKNLIRFTKGLLKIKTRAVSYTKATLAKEKSKLETTIQNCDEVLNKQWLLAKLNEVTS